MNYKYEFLIMFILSILSFSFDIYTEKGHYLRCRQIVLTYLILYVHHILYAYALFAWMSSNKYILLVYLIMLPLIFVLWQFNDGNCILSVEVNRRCGKKDSVLFNSFTNIVGFTTVKNSDEIYNVVVITLWLIGLYRFYKMMV